MSKIQEYLFIGGPMDGRTLHVQGCSTVRIPILGNGGFGAQLYRRERLISGEREYIVYVVDDIPGADIIGRLIAGYGVGPTIAEREI